MSSKKISSKKDYAKLALALHKKLRGKLAVVSKQKFTSTDDWSTMYTPGVGAVSSHLAKHPEAAREYTMKQNSVAMVSDGSAVLGLGNIGPLGSLPVMEGKCAILKEVADVDCYPIVLATQDAEKVVDTIVNIAPGFGAVNLEDIGAPRCFEIEEALKKRLDIPVMHDDQHGTSIVILAALVNAAKVVKKELTKLKVVIVGAGAAGRATALLLTKVGIRDIVICDSTGVIYRGRKHMAPYKVALAKMTNPRNLKGMVVDAAKDADAIVGVSGPGTITKEHVRSMAKRAIVFALANPVPEIMPEDAAASGAYVIATGRSDYPNQVNNSLVFPGIYRGALDKRVKAITDETKLRAARALAALVKRPTANCIIPHVSNPNIVKVVAGAVR